MSVQHDFSLEEKFSDYKPLFTKNAALLEANRCLFCYNAPCTLACPTSIDVPRFIKKIASDNPRGSAKVILDANILGASCARICPTEELCEGACVLNDLHETPIQIGRLQRYATEDFVINNKDISVLDRAEPNGKRVALIGAGPASLGCAAELQKRGYDCTCFDKNEKPGGLNSYGIADYKLRYEIAQEEIAWLSKLGITFEMNTEVGKDISVDTLLNDFDAVFLGIGLDKIQPISIPGEELDGVLDSLEFIRELKTQPKDELSLAGKNVAVIGGGNTAIDGVTQAKRLGADNVYLIYRRNRDKMRAYDHEQELALHDGAVFMLEYQPISIQGENGKVNSITISKTKNVDGKLVITEQQSTINVDLVLRATGQAKYTDFLQSIKGLELTSKKTPVVNEYFKTTHQKIWSGGDCVSGGKEVVNAVAEGKTAAKHMHQTLLGGK